MRSSCLAQSNDSGLPGQGYDVWLFVSFANGGTATGQWTGYFDPHPVMGLQVFDLTTLRGAQDFNEIIFQVSSGASHGQHGVMALIDYQRKWASHAWQLPTVIASPRYSSKLITFSTPFGVTKP